MNIFLYSKKKRRWSTNMSFQEQNNKEDKIIKIIAETLPRLNWFSQYHLIPEMVKQLQKIPEVPWERVFNTLFQYQWQNEYLPTMYRDRKIFNEHIKQLLSENNMTFTTHGKVQINNTHGNVQSGETTNVDRASKTSKI